MTKIKYGIMSTASIVTRFMKGVQCSKKGEVYAIASRNIEKARDIAEQFNDIKTYGSYLELLRDDAIDVIYIATPNYLHYEHVMEALKHNKHVVCEKPMTLTKKEAEALFLFAKKQGCFLMEAQKIVFLPITQWLKKEIEIKRIGEISYIQLSSSFPEGNDKSHWMYSHKKGGGVVYGSANYTIEYMQYLFDDNIESCHIQSVYDGSDVEEVASITMQIKDQCLIHSVISRKAPLKHSAVFYGTNGKIEVDQYWKSNRAIKEIYGAEKEIIEMPYTSEFVYEVDHINESISLHKLESDIMRSERTVNCIEIVEKFMNGRK